MEEKGTPGTIDARTNRLEIARQAAEKRYNELFEQAALGIVVSAPAGTVIACNPSFARMLGFGSVDEAIGTSMQDLYATASDRERFVAELDRKSTRLNSSH